MLDLVSFLDRKLVEPVCLSFTNGEMVSRLQQMGITCHVIKTEKPFDIAVQRQVLQLIADEHIQLVHAHGSRAASNVLWPAKHAHVPFIYTVHGWSFHDDQSPLVKKLRAWSEKLICHYADTVICVSQSNADTGRRVFGLKQSEVIENGINLERFNPDGQFHELRGESGFSASDFVVAFIARCTKQKNPLGFLAALKLAHDRNPQVKGLFVGEGDMDAEVDDMIAREQMGDYVWRSPFRTDVPDLLHLADAYCLPSLWEGLSIALLEAMAMRMPIIATPTDGTTELLIHRENGLVVPFNDTQALSDAILAYATNAMLCQTCGDNARQLVEQRFNARRVAEAVTRLYLGLV